MSSFFGGTGIDEVRTTFAEADIDHVLMGAGVDLANRLQIVREIFRLSYKTTVQMKGRATGPEGFKPFVRAVLHGLQDYEIKLDAIRRRSCRIQPRCIGRIHQ